MLKKFIPLIYYKFPCLCTLIYSNIYATTERGHAFQQEIKGHEVDK